MSIKECQVGTILFFIVSIIITLGAAQEIQLAPTTPPKDNKIIGIKYVDPLSNVAGRVAESDDANKYDCYRCNRFKGGASPCPETQRQIPGSNVDENAPFANIIVRNCALCMKVKTIMYHRNKDFVADKLWSFNPGSHFESMFVISRTCIEDEKDARLTDGCITDTAAGGTIERCYCKGDLCNASVVTTPLSVTLIAVACLLIYIFN